MADNGENILVEFDYQNIFIADPNKVIDSDGKTKDRNIKHENLVMYANLECEMIPRTKLAVGESVNDIETISLAKINFLNPTNEKYLNNNYTSFLTGTKTPPKPPNPNTGLEENSVQGPPKIVESSLLGITSINVKTTLSYVAEVNVVLEDVRGRALFELGDKSPYAAFFNLPYPKFFLTLKGFFGQAIRYQLMLQNFNASFDNETGNFIVRLKFYTYKYTMLSEVIMNYLLALPYMYKKTLKITQPTSNPLSSLASLKDFTTFKGLDKLSSMYQEYKSKKLIPDDFPTLTIPQLQKRLDSFIQNVLSTFGQVNLQPLTDLDVYSAQLDLYQKEVLYYVPNSWFATYVDSQDYYILKNGTKAHSLKPAVSASEQATINATNELVRLLNENNEKLNNNGEFGKNKRYEVKNLLQVRKIDIDPDKKSGLPDWIELTIKPEEIDFPKTFQEKTGKSVETNQVEYSKFVLERTTLLTLPNTGVTKYFYAFEGTTDYGPTFLERAKSMSKDLIEKKNLLIKKSTDELNNVLKNGNSSGAGLGFLPTIRNVLAVFFANAEAFMRLMDDVHTSAWNVKDDPIRKSIVLNKSSSIGSVDSNNEFVYPWPQIMKQRVVENETVFEVVYPGNSEISTQTQAARFDVWPEVEFVEELLKGFTLKLMESEDTQNTDPNSSVVSRLILNALEFPFTNQSYSNKEEVKFIYELWERFGLLTNMSRFSRGNAQNSGLHELIGGSEFTNVSNALTGSDVFLIKKLKDLGINSSNIIQTLRHISNQGQGVSWQEFARGYYSVPYLKSYTTQTITGDAPDWYLYDNTIFKKIENPNQSSQQLEGIDKIQNYTRDTKNNQTDILDVFPFNNLQSIKNSVSNGTSIQNVPTFYDTSKMIEFDEINKVISNFKKNDTTKTKRPYTYYNFDGLTNPDFGSTKTNQNTVFVKTLYENRTTDATRKNQFVTEGSIFYNNYSGQVSSVQSTSMMNTPYFINALQDSANKLKDGTSVYPFIKPAYLFLNSLPLSTPSEKYKTFGASDETELDYIFSSFKKFSGIHKIPYALVLKYGAIWYRYKRYIETGQDILDDVWTDFNYLQNYDPANSASTKTYIFTGYNTTEVFDITLQKEISDTATTLNSISLGFYPQVIEDLTYILLGRSAFTSNTYSNETIQEGIDNGIILSKDGYLSLDKGFDASNTGRTLNITSYSTYLYDEIEKSIFMLPSVGNQFNQTLNECFTNADSTTNQAKLAVEVLNNQSMYNGSVRLFWSAPNYGYFDNSKLTKPEFNQYVKTIFTTTKSQDNFSLNGTDSYSLIQDALPTFKKNILDYFESLFLKFTKSKLNFSPVTDIPADPQSVSKLDGVYTNFHMLFETMMKLDLGNQTGFTSINQAKEAQLNSIQNTISGFITYDVLLKLGNTSEYYKRIYLSFLNTVGGIPGQETILDPIEITSYNTTTPDVLPTSSNGVTLSSVAQFYPDAWKALLLNIGYTTQNKIQYTNTGSTIFDFFIDNDVAFTKNNVELFYPLIRIYATQKANDENYNPTKFLSDLGDYVDKINKLQDDGFNYMFTKLNSSLPNVNESPITEIPSQLIGNQAKDELWETLKAFNDKWIAGYDFKYKTLFEDVLLLDRASRDLGNEILVDVIRLNQMLANLNRKSNVLSYISSILQENNFQMMALPAYVNFYNVQDVISNPEPKLEGTLEFANSLFGTFKSVDYRNSSSKLVCLYAGKPSEHLDIRGDYRFKNDGFNLSRTGEVPIIENLSGKKDWGLSNRVVGFNVDIGINNQNIFTNFQVAQEAGKATSESMAVITDMGNSSKGTKSSTQSVSLYNLYKTRSYSCDVKMMGNALIQPTMYFNLRHVPMFSGPYMIMEVEHSIAPGVFTTGFKGIRQCIYSLPKIDSYLQSMRETLITSILNAAKKQTSPSNGGSANTSGQQVNNNQNNAGSLAVNPNGDCKVNDAYNLFTSVTPGIFEANFKTVYDKLVTITNTISNNDNRDKVRYIIWSLMYMSAGGDNGFKAWNWNMGGVRLDIVINNEQIKYSSRDVYLQENYFCLGDATSQNAYASFESLDKFLEFAKSSFEARATNLKKIKSGTTFTMSDEDLAKEITKFLTNYWPKKQTKDIYKEQLDAGNNNLLQRINLIKKGIGVAKTLGL
jgi:hypothetical protein